MQRLCMGIEQQHGGIASFVQFVSVDENNDSQTVWDGPAKSPRGAVRAAIVGENRK